MTSEYGKRGGVVYKKRTFRGDRFLVVAHPSDGGKPLVTARRDRTVAEAHADQARSIGAGAWYPRVEVLDAIVQESKR